MADTDKVSVTLEADTGSFKSNMQSAGQEATKLQQKIEELQRKADELSKRRENIRQSLISQYVSENGVGMGLVEKKLSTDKEYNKLGQQYDNIIAKVDTYKEKLQEASEVQGKIAHGLDNAEKEGGTALSKLASHMSQLSKKSNKLVLSLFSVRSAYSVLSRAAQSYMSADTKLSTQIKNAWFGLGALLAPVLEGLANMFTNLVTQVSAFVKALTGIDLIAKANAKALNSQAKSAGAVASASKDAVSSLDELNIINTETSSGGAGVGATDVTQFTPSDVDTSWATSLGEKLKPVWEGLQKMWGWLEKNKETIKKLGVAIAAAFVITEIVKFISEIKNVATALELATQVLDVGNLKWWLFAAAIGAIVYLGSEIADAWNDMSPIEKAITVLGALTVVATGAAIAIGAVQSAWTLGIAALAITAGIAAIAGSIASAKNRAEAEMASITGGGGGFAEGGIITKPSRILVGEKAREAVVPLTNQKAMTQLANEIGQYATNAGNNTQPIQVTSVLQVDRKTLATAVNRANYEAGASITKGAFAI